jgi:hypothetical protein
MGNTVKRVLVAVLAATLAAPATAQAQVNDPEKGSPAGTMYEIPLDTARDDAAPPAADDGGSAPASPVRSENGFGSSSEVPGVAPEESAPAPAPAPAAPAEPRERPKPRANKRKRDDRERPRPARAEPEERDDDDGAAVAAERLVSSTAPIGAEPSGARSFLLLALGVLVALALGAAARRATR